MRKINSKVTVSENFGHFEELGVERENLPRRILFLARSRRTFAVFRRRFVCFSTESTLVLRTGATNIGFTKQNSVISSQETFENYCDVINDIFL